MRRQGKALAWSVRVRLGGNCGHGTSLRPWQSAWANISLQRDGPPLLVLPGQVPAAERHELAGRTEASMTTGIETLRAALQDWTDWDVAGYSVAVALGLIDQVRSPFPTS